MLQTMSSQVECLHLGRSIQHYFVISTVLSQLLPKHLLASVSIIRLQRLRRFVFLSTAFSPVAENGEEKNHHNSGYDATAD